MPSTGRYIIVNGHRRSHTKRFKVKPVSAEFLRFRSLYFKNWDLQSILTPSSTRQRPWAKIQIKLVLIQELLRWVSFDPGSRIGSSQMSNYSCQPLWCIHTVLIWEASERLAGRGQKHSGASLLREGGPEVCPWPCWLTWPCWVATMQTHIYIYLALHALSAHYATGSLSASDNAVWKGPTDTPADFFKDPYGIPSGP